MRDIFMLSVFEKRLKKFLRYHPELKKPLVNALILLRKDVRSRSLRTHKLHGKMGDSYACSISYQHRIVFSFDDELVYLESIGSHDDVY